MKKLYKFIIPLTLIVSLGLTALCYADVDAITDAEVESVAKHVKHFSYKYANLEDSYIYTFNRKKHTGKLKIKTKVRAVKGYRFRVKKITTRYKLKNNKEVLVSKKTTYHNANKSKDTNFKFKVKFNKNEGSNSSEKYPLLKSKKNKYVMKYKNKNYYFKYHKAVLIYLQVKVNGIWQDIQ